MEFVVKDHVLCGYRCTERNNDWEICYIYDIPDGVVEIGESIFEDTSVEIVMLPTSVIKIGRRAFYRSGLEHVTLPEGLIEIGEEAFGDCSDLNSVTIPASVVTIGSSAFSGCHLQSVTIPEGVTKIGEKAFYNCTSLESVTLPKSVEQIGDGAFGDCESLIELTVDAKNPYFHMVDGVLYRGTSLLCCPAKKDASVVVEDGTKEIAPEAFSECKVLQSLTIPKSVEQIDNGAFVECDALEEIIADVQNPHFHTVDSVLYRGTSLLCCPAGKCGSVMVEDGTKEIAPEAFSGCCTLQSVTVPEGVTTIGEYAFWRCYNLRSVTIPESVTEIGESAFGECFSLQNVTIPESVILIGDCAFDGCKSLQSVSLQSSTIHNRRLPKINESIFGGFGISHPILIAPHLSISDFCEEDRPGACIGFAKLYCDQVPLSEDIRAGYLAYIRRERKALYARAMEHLPLLQVMTAEKIIPPEDFEELFQDALQKGGAERTALLLEYRHKYLKPVDLEREFELEEL